MYSCNIHFYHFVDFYIQKPGFVAAFFIIYNTATWNYTQNPVFVNKTFR